MPYISEERVCVDRFASLDGRYSTYVEEVLHPELELVGPFEYSLRDIGLWTEDIQCGDFFSGDFFRGRDIYDAILVKGILPTFLGLHDALAIKNLGIHAFRRFFGACGKSVHCWKSVVRKRGNGLHVLSMIDAGGCVMLGWTHLAIAGWAWGPAPRFNLLKPP